MVLSKMPEDTSATPATPTAPILQNARIKKPSKSKAVAKTRKARPLKNLEHGLLQTRLLELQKRVRTAECKMTLLKEKLGVHEEEVATRATVVEETNEAINETQDF